MTNKTKSRNDLSSAICLSNVIHNHTIAHQVCLTHLVIIFLSYIYSIDDDIGYIQYGQTAPHSCPSIVTDYHLPADSSIASGLYIESSAQSNLLCIRSYSCLLVTSTCCHSSHRSARPSPSSIRTTSDMDGRSSGDACVHSNAICIIISSSSLS
jgi:hypothetical protein